MRVPYVVTKVVNMTTTNENPAATTPPAQPYRQLRRSRDDRVIAGLSGGLGRYFDADPVLFRIMFVALTLCGGSGILIYLIGWLAIADDNKGTAFIDRVASRVRRRGRRR